MKEKWRAVADAVNTVRPYPFWVFLLFLYAAVIVYALCAVAAWAAPDWLTDPADAPRLAGLLFETGTGFLAAGGLGAPLMDLILRSYADGGK